MSSAHEAANILPSNFDIGGLSNALNNPAQVFSMLDKNNDGRVTKQDLALLLEQFGVNGMAAKVLSSYLFKQLDANNNGTIEPSDLVHANGILSCDHIKNIKKAAKDSRLTQQELSRCVELTSNRPISSSSANSQLDEVDDGSPTSMPTFHTESQIVVNQSMQASKRRLASQSQNNHPAKRSRI
ncbi:unnamed protein product [Rotaria socialis]|uniref:EF-hand domain-containing protein n=1 Tax=Rotaria socialis TaxID=392032 RepID=A0A818ERY5_9BILA|nr:unnamed protein product [Rotaria socialis]